MKYTMITGASSGIGFETALSFARLGKNLILVARRGDKLNALKDEIAQINKNLEVIIKPVDLSVSEKVISLYKSLKSYNIETLINNAGLGDFSSFKDVKINKIQTMLHVNIEALTLLTLHYVKDYENCQGAQVINISSVAGYKLVKEAISYCATKFYVSAFTEGLAAELKERGAKLQAKVLAPASTATPFWNIAFNDESVDIASKRPKIDSAKTIAEYLMELYKSDKTVGLVNRDTFEFSLTDPQMEFWK